MGRINDKERFNLTTWIKITLPIFCLGILSGCVSLIDFETTQNISQDIVATISPEHTVGQSLVSKRPNFNGINLWFRTSKSNIQVTVSLYHSPGERIPLQQITIQAVDGINKVEFDSQSSLPGQSYFIQLTVSQGEIQILGRNEDNYSGGTAYIDSLPIDGDLGFQATYDYEIQGVFADIRDLVSLWNLFLPLSFLLFIPGWVLLDMSTQRIALDIGEQIALSLGLSIAITPLVMVWSSVFGFKWSSASLWAISLVILLIFIWRIALAVTVTNIKGKLTSIHQNFSYSTLLLIAIFILSLFVRFAMVRDVVVPPWVDSVHHSLFTKKIIEMGGIPENYLPHIPIEGSKYHIGYHSLLASFVWLTGLEVPQGMLIFGQVMNAFSVFSVYLFSQVIVKDKRSSLIAALITGLLSLMPAYYVSWGRYTQLTGLLVLPTALYWIASNPSSDKRKFAIFLGGLSLSGLFLIHYRVAIFLACLVLAKWISIMYKKNLSKWKDLADSISTTVLIGLVFILLALPWLIPTMKEFVIPLQFIWKSRHQEFQDIHWDYLTPVFGTGIMVTAILGLILGWIMRRKFSLSLIIWVLLLIGVANPGYFHLPFPGGMINQSSVDIMLFMPLSVLSGFFTSQVIILIQRILANQVQFFRSTIFVIIGFLLAISGARLLLQSINPITILFKDQDRNGIKWISENIPLSETIVINPAPWGYGLYMGQDAGFWISPMTNHRTIPPNVMYGLSLEEVLAVNKYMEEITPLGESPRELWELFKRNDLQYIYIGSRGGILSPSSLVESNLFETLYHEGNNWVFKTIIDP
jgi:hypothetical protein